MEIPLSQKLIASQKQDGAMGKHATQFPGPVESSSGTDSESKKYGQVGIRARHGRKGKEGGGAVVEGDSRCYAPDKSKIRKASFNQLALFS